jgi:hypothetical protein
MRGGAIILAALGLAVWPAQAGATWGAPQTIVDPLIATSDPFLGADSAGEAFLAVGPDPAFSPSLSGVWISTRPPGSSSTFGAPVQISPTGGSGFQFGVAANGYAVAAWIDAGVVQVSERMPGGSFGAAKNLGAAPSARLGFQPELNVAPDGTAIVGWTRHRRVRVAVRPPGGEFSGSFVLRRRAYLGGVGAGRNGVVAAAYAETRRRHGDLQVKRWIIGERPGKAHRVRGTAQGFTEGFDLTAEGRAIAITGVDPRPGRPYLAASIERSNGSFPKAKRISAYAYYNEAAAMAVGDQGGAMLLWRRTVHKPGIAAAVLVPGARRFGRPLRVSGTQPDQSLLKVDMGGDGRAIAAWESAFHGTTVLNSAFFSAASGWSPTEAIPANPGPVDARIGVAMQDDGTAFAAWREFGEKGLLGGGLFVAAHSP